MNYLIDQLKHDLPERPSREDALGESQLYATQSAITVNALWLLRIGGRILDTESGDGVTPNISEGSMTRKPQEVFAAHVDAMSKLNVDAILADYTEDASFMTADAVMEGREQIEAFYTQALSAWAGAKFTVISTMFGGDALLFRWTAVAPGSRINDGVDTCIFADGAMRLHTSVFTIEPVE